jgi:arylsulfatase
MSAELTGKPSLAAGRKTFVYDTPLAALPEYSAPDLKNKSFTITAETEIPAGGANGMIFTQGGFTGGWGFYMQQGKLVGLHSHVALERYRVVSTEPVPTGKVTLAMDFKSDGGGMGKGGTITLLANGRKIGEGRVEKTTPFKYSLRGRTSARTAARRSTSATRRLQVQRQARTGDGGNEVMAQPLR